MDVETPKTRCVSCRTEIAVPESYATGDHIKCGVCGTQHKVQRGDVLRLILADVEPVRQHLRENERRIASLEDQLSRARGSLGLGANGIGIGLIYVLWQIGFKEQPLSSRLAVEGILVVLGAGILLEVANFLFLAKRSAIIRLSDEIEQLRLEGRGLEQRVRDALRK
jgi:hypothetical protein